MKTLAITLDKDLSNSPKPINLNLGVEELSDFVDLFFSAVETYLKAKADDKIEISDLALLGSFTLNLFAALTDSDVALAEAKDLTDEEITVLLAFADNYQLGSDVMKYQQLLKVVLTGFQTFTVFTT